MENIANTLLQMVRDRDSSSRLLLSKEEVSFFINDCIKNVFGTKELIPIQKNGADEHYLVSIKFVAGEDMVRTDVKKANGQEDISRRDKFQGVMNAIDENVDGVAYTLGYSNKRQAITCTNKDNQVLFAVVDKDGLLYATSKVIANDGVVTEVERTYNCENHDSSLKVTVNNQTTIDAKLNPYGHKPDRNTELLGFISGGKNKGDIVMFDDQFNIEGLTNKLNEEFKFHPEELYQGEGMKM